MTKSRLLKYAFLGITAALIAHYLIKKEEKPKGHPRDYAEIAAEGIIHASTEYNSISFYVDDDTLSGFHYELIEAFARDHGLQAAISPEMSFNKRLEGLADGQYDVIAYGILATSELKDSLLLTTPIRHPCHQRAERLLTAYHPHRIEQASAGAAQARECSRLITVHQKPTGPGGQDTARSERLPFHTTHPQPGK